MRAAFCVLVLSCLVSSAAVKVSQSARTVDCYEFVEVTLQLDSPPGGNPFVDAQCIGELRPSGTNFAPPRITITKGPHLSPPADPGMALITGFCDSEDGTIFRIRFLPTRAGHHEFAVHLFWSGLETQHTGSFEVRRGKRKGIVRVDPEHPTHFIYEGSGEHYFWNSTTTYWLLGWQDDAIIRESLDRLAKFKINRIRAALNARTHDGSRWREPDIRPTEDFQFRLEPWRAARPTDIENPGFDVTRFNLEHFRKCERMLTHALKRDIIVSLIFHLDGRDRGVDPFGHGGMGGPDEQRYYKYVIARFGAFPNIMWDVTNEWHLFRNEPWVEQMGEYIKACDPWNHLTSVHGNASYPFRKSKWSDYAMFQSWDEHGSYNFMLKNRREQHTAGRPMPQVNEEYGYEDHYPYPWGEKRVWPARIGESRVRLAWEMTMAGAYQTTGERANAPNYGGWITGRGNDEMTMLEGYARLRDFFERFEWWKLEPHPDLLSTNALCLAQPGVRYVLYLPDGGSATINLSQEKEDYDATQYDPRTGKYTKLPAAAGKWASPRMPKSENWVFLLERRRSHK